MATPEVKEHLKSWGDNYLDCRDFGHAWGDPMWGSDRAGELTRDLVCARCDTRRIDWMSSRTSDRGEVAGRRYIYPPGYLAKSKFKRGQLTKQDVRAEAIRRYLDARR